MPKAFRQIVVPGLAMVAAAILAVPAGAQTVSPMRCGAHDDIRDVLSSRFNETRNSIGLIGEEALVEVFVSSKGTWTILLTHPDGSSCILAAGHSWEQMPVLIGEAA